MGSEEFSHFFRFFSFFFAFLFFFVFLRFSSFFFAFLRFSAYSPGTRAIDCNLLGKWGISPRPRLHRPRSELPDDCQSGDQRLTIRTETMMGRQMHSTRFSFCICFCNDHVGHAQATTASHTYENKMEKQKTKTTKKKLEMFSRFCFRN